MKKEIKIEWCKNFIKSVFDKIPFENGGIEVNCFWNKAEKSGLWERGLFGSAMSAALEELTIVETVNGDNGEYLYTVFRLAKNDRRKDILPPILFHIPDFLRTIFPSVPAGAFVRAAGGIV